MTRPSRLDKIMRQAEGAQWWPPETVPGPNSRILLRTNNDGGQTMVVQGFYEGNWVDAHEALATVRYRAKPADDRWPGRARALALLLAAGIGMVSAAGLMWLGWAIVQVISWVLS